jgi:hypothetical protein
MLPPNEHPLDWFVIPELKGEPVTFIAYTKTGCVCRLCDTDKLTQVELQEHYQTPLHLQKHYQLEERRNELHTLVHQTEQELLVKHHQLLEEDHARTLETQRRVQDEAVRQEQEQKTKEQLPVRIAASERRAALKGTRDVQIIRERPVCEDLSTEKSTSDSSANGPSQQATTTATSRERIRQLRARRLAAQHHPQQLKNMPTKEEMIKQDKLREKEAKRLEVLETTRRHQQKQKEEEEAARLRSKLKVTTKQKRSPTSLSDDLCLGCMSSSFWE